MKNLIVLFSAMFIGLFLVGCGDDTTEDESADDTARDEVEETLDNAGEDDEDADEDGDEDEDIPAEAKDQDDMKEMMEGLNFNEIEVEISYGKDNEFEIELEHHDNGDVEAEVEDELNDENIDDDVDAFNYIYPNLTKLDVEKGTDKDEMIKQVLEAFDLEDDYEELEIEMTFGDGDDEKVSIED